MDRIQAADHIFKGTLEETRELLADRDISKLDWREPQLKLSARVIASTALLDLSQGDQGHILRVNENGRPFDPLFSLLVEPFGQDKWSMVLRTRLDHWFVTMSLAGERISEGLSPFLYDVYSSLVFKQAIVPFFNVLLIAGRTLQTKSLNLVTCNQVMEARRVIRYYNPG